MTPYSPAYTFLQKEGSFKNEKSVNESFDLDSDSRVLLHISSVHLKHI